MIINLTPHKIHIWNGSDWIVIEPSWNPARIEEKRKNIGYIYHEGHAIPLHTKEFYELKNVPEPRQGTWYAVSSMVALAAPDRRDLVVPTVIRDPQTKEVIGARGFDLLKVE